MGRNLKESLLAMGAGLLSGMGSPRFLHSRVYRNQLSILMYHAVIREPLQVRDWCFLDEDAFRKQISYVKQHFRVVPLSEAIQMLTTGSLDVPTLAITFDDGYQNNYDVAFPILANYDCPATIFLSTRYIDSDRTLWFCRLNLALALSAKRSLMWNGVSLDISRPAQKASASVVLRQALKTRHPFSIDELVTDICQKLEVNPDRKFESGSPYHLLRTDAIRCMMKSGLIDFGAHTHNHAILSHLSPTEQQDEISGSIKLVERLTGRPCKSFAYPNGSADDYDLSSIEILKSAGVETAVSTLSGPNTRSTPLLELRRYGVGSDLDLFKFMVRHVTHRIRQIGAHRKHAAPIN